MPGEPDPVHLPYVVAAVRDACLFLPEVIEEEAWVGTRWQVRGRTFAHVLAVQGGKPHAYAGAAGTPGPAVLLMFRSSGAEGTVLRHMGRPFFAPIWRADEVGMIVGDDFEDEEVTELVTESYCVRAPATLVARVIRPTDFGPG